MFHFGGKVIISFLTELLLIMPFFTTILSEVFSFIRRSEEHVNKIFCVHFSKVIGF